MSTEEPLKHILCLERDAVSRWRAAKEKSGEDSVVWCHKSAPLTVCDTLIVILVVPGEEQVGLFSVVVGIADVGEETFAEFSLGK